MLEFVATDLLSLFRSSDFILNFLFFFFAYGSSSNFIRNFSFKGRLPIVRGNILKSCSLNRNWNFYRFQYQYKFQFLHFLVKTADFVLDLTPRCMLFAYHITHYNNLLHFPWVELSVTLGAP